MEKTENVLVGKTKMIAHRGLSCMERENTAAAFVAAANRSFYGIETDLRRTADGRFILLHDANTERVSGTLKTVSETSFEELRRLRLPDPDGGKREDLCLATLEEYVGICRRYGKRMVLELKGEYSPEELSKVMEVIGDEKKTAILISFSYQSLLNLRKVSPGQHAQYLCHDIDMETLQRCADDSFGIDIAYRKMTPALLKECKKRNVETNVWTVDDRKTCEQLAKMGVDYITTNRLVPTKEKNSLLKTLFSR